MKRPLQIVILLCIITVFTLSEAFLPRFFGYSYVSCIYVLLWLSLCFYIYFQPRVRFASKLKLRPFLFLWVFLTAVLYIITFFTAGAAFGTMGRSPFSLAPLVLLQNLIVFVSVPVMMEWVRNYVINGAPRKRQFLFALVISLLYTLLSINLMKIAMLHSLQDVVSFAGGDLLPALVLNAFLCYVVYLGGAPMGMIYQAITLTPIYLLPVLPDLNWLAKGLIGTLFPLFSLYVLREVYRKRTGEAKERETKKENPFGWIATLVVSMVLVWFIAGLFPVYPVTIMSGSMEPLVYPGDVVMIQREAADKMKVGDIVQYWSTANNIYIIHRVIATDVVNGETAYITKGDNNSMRDIDPVKAEQIRGKVIATVPKLGYLTYLVRAR